MEYFNCSGSMTTSEARCAWEINSRTGTTKAAISKNKTIFTSRLDLNLGKKLFKCYIWCTAFYGAETWEISESRSEIAGKM